MADLCHTIVNLRKEKNGRLFVCNGWDNGNTFVTNALEPRTLLSNLSLMTT